MGILANYVKEYLASSTGEQLRLDWEELKKFNAQGPDMLDVLCNYGRGSYIVTPLICDEPTVSLPEFSASFQDSDAELYMAA